MNKLQKITAYATAIVAVLNVPPAVHGFYKWLTDEIDISLAQGIREAYGAMYGWLFTQIPVPTWLVVLVVAALSGVSIRWVFVKQRRIRAKRKMNWFNQAVAQLIEPTSEPPKELDVLNQYRTKFFFNAHWTWDWTYPPPRIVNLTPSCKKCGEKLTLRAASKDPEHSSELICHSDICEGTVANIFGGWSVERLEKEIIKDVVGKGMRMLNDPKSAIPRSRA